MPKLSIAKMVAGNKTAVEESERKQVGKGGARLAKFVKRAGKKLARIPVYIYRPEVLLSRVTTFLTTGIPELDEALGGGLPVGRFVEIFGDESCLAGDTHIQYAVSDGKSRARNSKGGTLARLYERFHGVTLESRKKRSGLHLARSTKGADFYAPSVNDAGRIVWNRIRDVVRTGEKKCYRVITKGGYSITSTNDHKFWTGDKFAPLSELSVGSTVFIHNNTRYKCLHAKPSARVELYVKHRPIAPKKKVKDGGKTYVYHVLRRSRAVVEADMNGLRLDDYVAALNAGKLNGLKFLPATTHVHHRDENVVNDRLSNLEAIFPEEHGRRHALDRHENLRYVAIPDQIVSIDLVGVRETFDVKMDAPFHNFVADNFVVHNCGKSATLHLVISLMHKNFPKSEALLADTETALDDRRIQSYKKVGMDLSRLAYTTPTTMEEFFDILDLYLDDRIEAIEVGVKIGDKLVKQDLEPAIVGLDSIATTPPKSCMDRETMDKATIGAQARALSDGLRQVNNKFARARVLFIAINQNRTKIGAYAPMGVTPTDSPGGKAPKFYATIRIKLKNTEPIPKSGSPRLGTFVEAATIKNKLTPPKQKVEFVLDYSCGISPEFTLFHNLLRRKKVRPQGGGKYALSWAKSKPFVRADFPAMLLADPELKQKCMDKLREKAEPEEKSDDD